MGYLLGAAPSPAGPTASGVSEHSPALTPWVAVDDVRVHRPPPEIITRFAIDSPRSGDRGAGQGIEINGWAIGAASPVSGVRAIIAGEAGAVAPLDVWRPDVAADYPTAVGGELSGFSFWTPFGVRPHPPTAAQRAPGSHCDGRGGEAGEAAWAGSSDHRLFASPDTWLLEIEAVLADGVAVPLAEIRGRSGRSERVAPPGSRLVTAPDFVIIGAQRGGTTSLHAYLGAHPLIQTATTKELHYFTDRFERGGDWYRGQFPDHLAPGMLTGEATPYALFHPLAPERLRAAAPETKLIVLLRNPIDRAYSHYLMERARGDEPLEFSAALAAEPARLAGEEARLRNDPSYVSHAHKHFSYAARGEYATQLERWFRHVPRQQMLILRSEDLYARTAETFARVADFLEIPPHTGIPFAAHNRTAGPPLPPAIRDRLARHFAPANARLANLLGWDPEWD